jgi:hypothetical protein
LLLFPVGAWALSFSNVAITDPGGTNQARVTAQGKLKVDTGLAPWGVMPVFGQGGSFTRAAPADIYRLSNGAVTSNVIPYITPSAGKQLVILTAHITWYNVVASTVPAVQLSLGTNGSCANTTTIDNYFLNTPQGFQDASFEPGLVIPAGKTLCAVNFSIGSPQFPQTYLSLDGYFEAA